MLESAGLQAMGNDRDCFRFSAGSCHSMLHFWFYFAIVTNDLSRLTSLVTRAYTVSFLFTVSDGLRGRSFVADSAVFEIHASATKELICKISFFVASASPYRCGSTY